MGRLFSLLSFLTALRSAVSQDAQPSTDVGPSTISGRPTSSSPSSPTWSFEWASGSSLAVTGSGGGTAAGSFGTAISMTSSNAQATLSGSTNSTQLPNLPASTIGSIPISSISSDFFSTSKIATEPGPTATSTSGASGTLSLISILTTLNTTGGAFGMLSETSGATSLASTGETSATPSTIIPSSFTGGTTGAIPTPVTSSSPLVTTLAPLLSLTLPPSGVSIAPSGTAASSAVIVFGNLLDSLSSNIRHLDLTQPTIKAEVLDDIENTINKANNLFDDLGGTDLSSSCAGASKFRRALNPFQGLENLAGDVIKTIGCASNVLESVKSNLGKDTPDPDLTEDLLADLGTLADNTEPDNDQPSGSASGTTASETAGTTDNPSSASSASSSVPSSSQASTGTATGCTGCCPTDVPALPTDGSPAVTAAPTDFFDPLDKRSIPERFQRLGKRKEAVPVAEINGCNLKTPQNWPVTTPAYPGGYAFFTSDTKNELGTLTTISRYYRSTTFGEPACTPTITRIDAGEWTFPQNGKAPENDKVSVDHAYELGFLKSFMESIIDKSNGLTCANANAQFFDTGNCPDNRLQPIFGALPSYANPDFIAMSQWLNGDAKGWVLGPIFDPALGGSLLPGNKVRPFDSFKDGLDKIKRKMSFAQVLVEAALIINADNTLALIQKTNNRIYAAFQAHDNYLKAHSGLPRANFGWANKYKTYMNNYVTPRNGASARLLPDLLTNIATDLTTLKTNLKKKDQLTWDQWNNLHNSISTYYGEGGDGAAELQWSIDWEWNAESVKRDEIEDVLEKRHVEKRQACSRPTGPSSGSGPPTTGPGTTQPSSTSTGNTPTETVSSIPSVIETSNAASPSSSSSPSLPPSSSSVLPSTTEPPPMTKAPSTTYPMVTYPCSTFADNLGTHCRCGPFAEGDSPAYCPPSTVVAGPSVSMPAILTEG